MNNGYLSEHIYLQTQVLYSPLGETALFITVVGAAVNPNSSGDLTIKVPAMETHKESLSVYNITEASSYLLVTLKKPRCKVCLTVIGNYYNPLWPDLPAISSVRKKQIFGFKS